MNAASKAVEAYFEAHPNALDSSTLGTDAKVNQYLANRLRDAVIYGFCAGEQACEEQLKERFDRLFLRPG